MNVSWSLSALRKKEVIDLSSGLRLGFIYDAELDLSCGLLSSLLVREKKFFLPRRYRVAWSAVRRISDALILAESSVLLPPRCGGEWFLHRLRAHFLLMVSGKNINNM